MINRLNKTYIILTGLHLACIFICSCKGETSKGESKNSYSTQESPLDTILGDKILNDETGEMRKDNFKSLLKIKKQQLQIESTLYSIKQLDNYHFVLKQKRNYADARNFDILIKTDDLYITNYIVFNDFLISDIKLDSNYWVLLLSDFNQTNTYWKSDQQIKIVKLDSSFKELWTFTKNSTLPLFDQSLNINTNNYSFNIEVITGCHICYTLAQLVLTKDGQFSSVKSIEKQNFSEISDTELQAIFNDK